MIVKALRITSQERTTTWHEFFVTKYAREERAAFVRDCGCHAEALKEVPTAIQRRFDCISPRTLCPFAFDDDAEPGALSPEAALLNALKRVGIVIMICLFLVTIIYSTRNL